MDVIEENKRPEDYDNDRQGRAAATLSYIPLAGLLFSLFLHYGNKNSFSAFHLRQSLGLHVAMMFIYLFGYMIQIIPWLGWWVKNFLWLGLFILFIIGIINAANEKRKVVPYLGETFAKVFSGID